MRWKSSKQCTDRFDLKSQSPLRGGVSRAVSARAETPSGRFVRAQDLFEHEAPPRSGDGQERIPYDRYPPLQRRGGRRSRRAEDARLLLDGRDDARALPPPGAREAAQLAARQRTARARRPAAGSGQSPVRGLRHRAGHRLRRDHDDAQAPQQVVAPQTRRLAARALPLHVEGLSQSAGRGAGALAVELPAAAGARADGRRHRGRQLRGAQALAHVEGHQRPAHRHGRRDLPARVRMRLPRFR